MRGAQRRRRRRPSGASMPERSGFRHLERRRGLRVRRRRAPARDRRRPGAALPRAVRAGQAGHAPRPRAHRAADGHHRGLGDDDDRRRDARAAARRRRLRQPRHRARAATPRAASRSSRRSRRCRSTTCPTASATSCWPRAAPRTSSAELREFDGKVALVTGGAQRDRRGGRSRCCWSAARAVASVDLNAGASPDGALAVDGDVTDSRSVADAVAPRRGRAGPARRGRVLRGHGRRLAADRRRLRRRVAARLRAQLRRRLLLQPRGRPRDGPARARADRQRRLDRRQGGQPDGRRLLGEQGRGDRDDEVDRQGPRRPPACSSTASPRRSSPRRCSTR